ncbi:hypothetical protein PAMP_013977 [Pampus punctatissimus]
MDTLFSVFLGLLFLLSTVGNVSGQIPTAHMGRAEKGAYRQMTSPLRLSLHPLTMYLHITTMLVLSLSV